MRCALVVDHFSAQDSYHLKCRLSLISQKSAHTASGVTGWRTVPGDTIDREVVTSAKKFADFYEFFRN